MRRRSGVGIATQKVGGGPEESDLAVLRLDGTVPEIGQRHYECIPEVLLGLRFFAFAIVLLKRLAPALGILGGALRDQEKPSGAKRSMAYGRATVPPSLPSRTNVGEPDPSLNAELFCQLVC